MDAFCCTLNWALLTDKTRYWSEVIQKARMRAGTDGVGFGGRATGVYTWLLNQMYGRFQWLLAFLLIIEQSTAIVSLFFWKNTSLVLKIEMYNCVNNMLKNINTLLINYKCSLCFLESMLFKLYLYGHA